VLCSDESMLVGLLLVLVEGGENLRYRTGIAISDIVWYTGSYGDSMAMIKKMVRTAAIGNNFATITYRDYNNNIYVQLILTSPL
jgi:thiamine monophosphate kinase